MSGVVISSNTIKALQKVVSEQNNVWQIVYLFFGFMLGIVSSVVLDYKSNKQKKNNFLSSVNVELQDIASKLTIIRYRLLLQTESLSKENMKELSPYLNILEDNRLLESELGFKKIMLQICEKYIDTEEDIPSNLTKKEGDTLSMKKIRIKYVENNIDLVSLCNLEIQQKIFQILKKIDAFNEIVEEHRFLYEKTFDSTLSSTNREIITKNMTSLYKQLENFSAVLMRDIKNVIELLAEKK